MGRLPTASFAWPRISDYWPDDADRRPPAGEERAVARPRSVRSRPAAGALRSPLIVVAGATLLLAVGFVLARMAQPDASPSGPWVGAAALPRESPGAEVLPLPVESATSGAGPTVTATSTRPTPSTRPTVSAISGRRGAPPSTITITPAPRTPPGARTGPIVGVGDKCVDVTNGSDANGTPVQIWDCNNSAQQQWTIGADGTIRALGKCLDVTGQGTANRTPIQLWDCNGSGGQAWVIESRSHLRNPQSGRYLDVPGGYSANGAGLQIYEGNTNPWQVWHLPIPMPNSTS
ncbi:RICIN domain-containing protein [Winogradskya humida]|uniref:RICIN domain-containing protein n=1 Tax=Winogradskya humida TaxID=113566 RepID=UPI001EF2ADB3|nr:RICIN domain-containing protein [Actinoplanes humidus]